MVCPCCVTAPPCCGIPTNCTATLTIDGIAYIYNQVNGLWEQEGDATVTWPSVSLGGCQNEEAGTGDPKYASCCLAASVADTPLLGEGLCNEYSTTAYARLVCDECCGELPTVGINCRLEDEVTYTTSDGPCDAFIPTIQFTLVCDEEECNPLP